jgi:hypothetical protein
MPTDATSRDEAIQPLPRERPSVDHVPRSWRPGYGDNYDRLPLYYRFEEAGLPKGDIRIIVATNDGQETFTVRAQDRERIR